LSTLTDGFSKFEIKITRRKERLILNKNLRETLKRKRRKIRKEKRKAIKIKWKHKNIVLKDGGYRLGPKGKYFLSEESFIHIIDGEFSERLIEKNKTRTGEKEIILKGGLHTYQGWVNFKKIRNDIVHLKFYNSNKDKLWYYARNLPNGVITLRIPKELFQSNAANLTRYPDLYYKSGYLWKTLFPKDKTKSEILSIIDESLYNIDKEESTEKILIGYALRKHPFTALKIRIQCQGMNINSAFPTWDQPMTGNTGKAYSHTDSISLAMALSTEFFDDNAENNNYPRSNIYIHEFAIDSMVSNTPDFILKRPMLPKLGKIDLWNSERETVLTKVASISNEKDIISLKEYLSDSFICKDGFHVQLNAYNDIYDDLKDNIELFNTISISQNIIETLTVINYYDEKNKTLHLIEAISHILQNKILYTGALDNWNNKRLHNKILDFVGTYHSDDIIPIYLNCLSRSPIRNSLYIEFDIANICYKKELDLSNDNDASLFAIINMPPHNNLITFECFKDYFLYNLGENYFINFDIEKRNHFINKMIEDQGTGFKRMIIDCLKLTSFDDLVFFAEKFSLLTKRIIDKKISGIDKESLAIIVKDYFRIQVAQRQKILLRNPDFVLDAIDYFDFESDEYIINTIIKHERRVNVFTLEQFLDDSKIIASYINYDKLVSKIEKYKSKVWTERPPLQKAIPNYIEHWNNQKDQSWQKDESFEVFPRPKWGNYTHDNQSCK
jgi:hypothetical protein